MPIFEHVEVIFYMMQKKYDLCEINL